MIAVRGPRSAVRKCIDALTGAYRPQTAESGNALMQCRGLTGRGLRDRGPRIGCYSPAIATSACSGRFMKNSKGTIARNSIASIQKRSMKESVAACRATMPAATA